MNATGSLVAPRAPRIAAWLVDPLRECRALYIQVALAAVLINLFSLSTALFSMTVFNRIIPNNAQSSLVALSIGIAIVFVFDLLLRNLRAWFVDVAGAQIDQRTGTAMFGKLITMPLDQRKGTAGAFAGLLREIETLREFFTSATLTALVDVPFILLFLAVIAALGGVVVLVPAIMVPIVALMAFAVQPAIERTTALAMDDGLTKQGVLVETIGGLEAVKSAGAGPLLRRRFLAALDRQSDSALRSRLVATVGITASTTGQNIAYVGVIILGVHQIAVGNLTMGALIACSILSSRAVAPMTQIAQLLAKLAGVRTAYRQLNRLMEGGSEGPDGSALRRTVSGDIQFREVRFRYPGQNEAALADLSFRISPGERVALVGPIGSGKSTVARLLLGLYAPNEGSVLIDGADVRQLDPAHLRNQIGTVLQDAALFSGSLRENIVLDRDDVDDEEMIRVAKLSGAHDFIGTIADGYDLDLTDRGEGLSGGQRQSIAIARALIGSPKLLLLDEPTSAMDLDSEARLIRQLGAELAGRTLLVITHRQSLLQLVQRVIVLVNGKVADDGPRDMVLARLAAART